MSFRRARAPLIEAERRLIRTVLAVGIAGGGAIWIAVGELAGKPGVIALLAICGLVGAAVARAVGACPARVRG